MTSSREDSQHSPPPAAAAPHGPRPHDVICQTPTRNAAGADATAFHDGYPEGIVPALTVSRVIRAAQLLGAGENVPFSVFMRAQDASSMVLAGPGANAVWRMTQSTCRSATRCM